MSSSAAAAFSRENRARFLVRRLFDVDGNGLLDKEDFLFLAVRATVDEGKGEWNDDNFEKNRCAMGAKSALKCSTLNAYFKVHHDELMGGDCQTGGLQQGSL